MLARKLMDKVAQGERLMDIFEFWSSVDPMAYVHPADAAVFNRVPNHGFDLSVLPGCFMGPLRTAPVVLLFLSPGLDEGDRPTPALIEWNSRTRSGTEPLVGESTQQPTYRWWTKRTRFLEDDPDSLADKVAVLNIGAYHSRTFEDHGLLAALPSSRVSLGWAQSVLFPAAECGERVVICLRAARYWGLEAGANYSGTLFAPHVTRGGHVHKDERQHIVSAVQRLLAKV
jgi:hypothetical protein